MTRNRLGPSKPILITKNQTKSIFSWKQYEQNAENVTIDSEQVDLNNIAANWF
jgi:hypothetical protein